MIEFNGGDVPLPPPGQNRTIAVNGEKRVNDKGKLYVLMSKLHEQIFQKLQMFSINFTCFMV